MGSAGSGHRTAVAVLAVLVAVAGCGGSEDPGGSGGEAARDWPAGLAALGILEAGVDVADEPADIDGAVFRTGEDGEELAASDVVRTDASGLAEVRWFEGALARIDTDTLLEITELDVTTGQPRVSAHLDVGRVWSRLDSGSADYAVATDVGTAAVRGTGFLVSCTTTCSFGVAEGVLDLRTSLGVTIELQPGEQVTVDQDGQPGEIEPFDIDDPWVQENLQRDETLGFPGVTGSFDEDGSERPQLASSRLEGDYSFSFTMQDSSEPSLVGQEVDRTWRFTPDCDSGPCGGGFEPGDGGTEPFVWTGTGYAATWIDRPAGECPDGSARWLEDLAITVTPAAFDTVDGRDVATEVEATWESTLTPTPKAVESGCDGGDAVDQLLVGTGARVG